MMPKIEFVYSFQYADRFRQMPITKEYLSKRGEKYPTPKKIRSFIKRIKKIWTREGQKVLREISKISRLKWKEKEIKCYIIWIGRALSSPLTIKVTNSPNELIDTLTRKLIHQIQSQNYEKFKNWLEYIADEYKEEKFRTQNHILLHALHKKICLSLYNKRRLKNLIKSGSIPNYKNKKTSEEIIKKFWM